MARLRSLLRRRVQRLLRSLQLKLRRWLVGMAERCCRVRRCGHVSRGVVSRAVSRRRARAVVEIVIVMIVESVVDVDGIAGVAAMRKLRWKRLGALRRGIMLLLTTRCWMQRRVRVRRMRLVRVLRVRMVSAGGVDVADGGVDVGLRVRLRQRRQLGMRRMSLA